MGIATVSVRSAWCISRVYECDCKEGSIPGFRVAAIFLGYQYYKNFTFIFCGNRYAVFSSRFTPHRCGSAARLFAASLS